MPTTLATVVVLPTLTATSAAACCSGKSRRPSVTSWSTAPSRRLFGLQSTAPLFLFSAPPWRYLRAPRSSHATLPSVSFLVSLGVSMGHLLFSLSVMSVLSSRPARTAPFSSVATTTALTLRILVLTLPVRFPVSTISSSSQLERPSLVPGVRRTSFTPPTTPGCLTLLPLSPGSALGVLSSLVPLRAASPDSLPSPFRLMSTVRVTLFRLSPSLRLMWLPPPDLLPFFGALGGPSPLFCHLPFPLVLRAALPAHQHTHACTLAPPCPHTVAFMHAHGRLLPCRV